MTMPTDIGAIDLMIGFPKADAVEDLRLPAPDDARGGRVHQGVPRRATCSRTCPTSSTRATTASRSRSARWTSGASTSAWSVRAPTRPSARMKDHPDRFIGSIEIDPNDITGAVRKIRQMKDEHDIKAVTTFPAGCNPQVPVDDRRYYPIYQTCIDLDIPIVSNAGIAGPRFPSACQDVMLFDEVCYDFPELRIVMRHGAEPWEELAVKLMLKWPNLYYMPSAFAPKHYPKAIIDYANTRGADKIMYAGYYPMGLSLERIFTEMPERAVPRPRVAEVPARERDPRLQARRDHRREARPAPDRVRGQRARRGGDRGRRRGAARRRVGAAHRQERQGVRAGRRRVLREAARDHVQLRARRRSYLAVELLELRARRRGDHRRR